MQTTNGIDRGFIDIVPCGVLPLSGIIAYSFASIDTYCGSS